MAGAWKPFREFKLNLGTAGIDLGAGAFRLALFTSAASASLTAGCTRSTIGSLANQLAVTNKYSAGGRSLTNVTWAFSGNNVKFDSDNRVLSASGGDWLSVKFGVIHKSAGILICYSTLSVNSFSVTDGSTLTVSMNASGILVLS
jgi:hypothetical protein